MQPEVAALADFGRQPPVPYLASWVEIDGSLQVEQWLRILPGKRYVGRAKWQGQDVLVKLFVGARAGSKAAAEVHGYERLKSAGLQTPDLLQHGTLSDAKGAWVLTGFVSQAQTLAQLSGFGVEAEEIGTINEQARLLQVAQVVHSIARLHESGLQQKDVHPGNFLLREDQCWIIDAADVVPVSDSQGAISNLAMFLAQLPESLWEGVWSQYQQLTSAEEEYDKVAALAWRWQAWRARDLADKSIRDCSLFVVKSDWRRFSAVWRSENDSIQELLSNPDAILATSTLLKNGGSATVGLVEWRGRQLVIKRYNLKGLGHRLQRCWRPTRAWHSWQAGHRLRVLGINTPRPIAMIEERWGLLRGRGYLITEVAAGQDLVQSCEQSDDQQLQSMAEAVRNMLHIMARHCISHGDFKATNLLWNGVLSMIDLDAVSWHKKSASWRRAFSKDKLRLLRNWDTQSREYQCFQQAIADVTRP